MENPKYFIRSTDYAAFKHIGDGLYRVELNSNLENESTSTHSADVLRKLDFIPWDSDDLGFWNNVNDLYYKWSSHISRPDGHGGSKGGDPFPEWLLNEHGIRLDVEQTAPQVTKIYKFTEEKLEEFATEIMNLGMTLRQNQMSLSDSRSGKEVLNDFLKNSTTKFTE